MYTGSVDTTWGSHYMWATIFGSTEFSEEGNICANQTLSVIILTVGAVCDLFLKFCKKV